MRLQPDLFDSPQNLTMEGTLERVRFASGRDDGSVVVIRHAEEGACHGREEHSCGWSIHQAGRTDSRRSQRGAVMARRRASAVSALLLGALFLAGCAGAPPRPVAAAQPTTITVPGVTAPVTILVDRFGIPHISAASEADEAFAMGYMHARDRRFQMELLRMDALGRLREMLGSRVPTAVLRLEIFSRALGFAREARRVVDSLPAEDQAILDAYANGVNAATADEPQPFEFRLLGYTPQPWTAADSVSILEAISFGFCKDWEQELVRLEIVVYQLHHGYSVDHALEIWPPRFDFPPHLIGVKPAQDPFASIPPMAPELASFLEQNLIVEQPRPGSPTGLSQATDPLSNALGLQFLSNNWAVDGAWTGTGKSAFAVDPHMPSSLPPLPYIVAMRLDSKTEGSYRVFGAGFPGLPAVPFGTNGNVAWGPTSNWADVTDLFVEKPSPGRPGYYQTESGDRKFDTRVETFRVRRGRLFTEEKRVIRSTRHGVLVNDFVDRLPRSFPLVALERAPTLNSASFRSMRLLYRAATVEDARKALQGFTAMVGHWVFADSSGNIGYASPVELPLRHNSLGTFPVPGWNGKYEWDGFVPADELPGLENPPQGFIATANNQVVQPESAGYPINFEGDVPFRVERIMSRLGLGRSGPGIAGQMGVLQTDGMDESFRALRGLVEQGLEPLAESRAPQDALRAQAARTLLDWDGSTDPDSPAPTLYQSLLTSLMNLLLSGEMSPATLDFIKFYFNSDPLLFGMLMDLGNPAWKDRATRHGEQPADVVAHAFSLSVAALEKRYGNKMSAWTWRRAAPVTLANPLGGIPGFHWMNRGGIPPRGSANSIWIHKFDRKDPARFPVLYGPGLRLVVDFNNLSASLISIPGGESGNPDSRHYADILPLFEKGEGVGLEMDPANVAESAEERLVLQPYAGTRSER
jgi:penicillin G amidase